MTTAEKTANILHQLIASFVSDAGDVTVATEAAGDSARFTLGVTDRDYPKVVGMGGAHIRALQELVIRIGQVDERRFELYLPEREGRPKVGLVSEDRVATDHNPMVEHDLLNQIFEVAIKQPAGPRKCVRDPAVSFEKTTAGDKIRISFAITTLYAETHVQLITPQRRRGGSMSLEAAIGTIFRAIGGKCGVIFDVDVYRK